MRGFYSFWLAAAVSSVESFSLGTEIDLMNKNSSWPFLVGTTGNLDYSATLTDISRKHSIIYRDSAYFKCAQWYALLSPLIDTPD